MVQRYGIVMAMDDHRPPWERGPAIAFIDADIERALTDSGASASVCKTGDRERRFVPSHPLLGPHVASIVSAPLIAWGYFVEIVHGGCIVSIQ